MCGGEEEDDARGEKLRWVLLFVAGGFFAEPRGKWRQKAGGSSARGGRNTSSGAAGMRKGAARQWAPGPRQKHE